MIVLIFIYYFKNILSIRDIEQLLQPLTEKHFHTDAPLQIDQIYQEVCELEKMQIPDLKEELQKIKERRKEQEADTSSALDKSSASDRAKKPPAGKTEHKQPQKRKRKPKSKETR